MTKTLPKPLSLQEFDALFKAVCNWGRWGPDDERGTLNYLTPEHLRAAARLVRSGSSVSMAIPINKLARPTTRARPRTTWRTTTTFTGKSASRSSARIFSAARFMATATRTWTRSATSPTKANSTTASRPAA